MHLNPGEGRPFLFSFCLLRESVHRNARCAVMATLFGCLQHSTVYHVSSSVSRFSFPLHFTCLAVRSKEQNSAFLMCTQLSRH